MFLSRHRRGRHSPALFVVASAIAAAAIPAGPLIAQRAGMFRGSSEDPAIAYSTAPLHNVVADLNRQLQDGSRRLTFDRGIGYLQSALDALEIPVDSQLLVFSPTSFQAPQINEGNPRAVFFNDRVALGWVRGGGIIEVAAQDASQGVAFYTLEQRQDSPESPAQFKRASLCLGCHMAGDTLGVPGLLMFSTSRPSGPLKSGVPAPVDQSTPLQQRFGGWFVTGRTGTPHMGNMAAALDGRAGRELASVEGLFDTEGFRARSSDIAAHLVLSHQAGMFNLLTRAGWEARAADPALHAPFVTAPGDERLVATMMNGIASEVVDYLLFIDEAKLTAPVEGSSSFTERFSASGPKDRQGRSLHQLDLTRRMMRYPCSYLIYSPTFDALPPSAKDPIYRRVWEVLSGEEQGERYRAALSLADRQAVVEILRDTKTDLPSYFQGQVR